MSASVKIRMRSELARTANLRDWLVDSYKNGDGRTAYEFTHLDTIRVLLMTRRLSASIGGMESKTPTEIAAICQKLVDRVQDVSRCNHPDRMFYFCDLKKGHKGKHIEDSGHTWD